MLEKYKLIMKQKQLATTLDFRDEAKAGNSFMAADKFHDKALKLENEIFDLEQIIKEKEKKANKPDIERIIGAIDKMPLSLIQKIKTACENRLKKK